MQVGEPLQMRKPLDCGDSRELIFSPAFQDILPATADCPTKAIELERRPLQIITPVNSYQADL